LTFPKKILGRGAKKNTFEFYLTQYDMGNYMGDAQKAYDELIRKHGLLTKPDTTDRLSDCWSYIKR
jgi:hypothetical protein